MGDVAPYFQTSDTRLAACLISCGVKLIESQHDITNIYSVDHKFRPHRPGKVTYNFKLRNDDGISAYTLAEAYQDGGHDVTLDALIDQLPPEITTAMKQALYLAMMVYTRNAVETLVHLSQAWQKREPLIKIEQGSRKAIVLKDGRSEDTNRRLNALFP